MTFLLQKVGFNTSPLDILPVLFLVMGIFGTKQYTSLLMQRNCSYWYYTPLQVDQPCHVN